jgi:eukaryotic-like serine/threonine-protein kinase
MELTPKPKAGAAFFAKYRIWIISIPAILLVYLFFDTIAMPLYTRQYQAIAVPDVTFKSFAEAEALLAKSGLRIVKDGEKFDETLPAGRIVFQSPDAFAMVKKGRRIYVTMSKGGRTFPMPKLTGQSERDARFILQANELSLGRVDYRRDPFLPDGVVCDQSISAGDTIGVRQRVDLTVSLGVEPTEYIVPDLVGKSIDDALMALRKAGLTAGNIQEQSTEELLPNTVVAQSLEAGKQVAKADTVHLVVSVLP